MLFALVDGYNSLSCRVVRIGAVLAERYEAAIAIMRVIVAGLNQVTGGFVFRRRRDHRRPETRTPQPPPTPTEIRMFEHNSCNCRYQLYHHIPQNARVAEATLRKNENCNS